MKLVALTYGTEGDTRPLAALCRAFMDAGHEVTLLADGRTLGSARVLGVPHVALAGDIRKTLQSVGNQGLTATAPAVARIANDNADAWLHQVLDVAAGSDALIVAGIAAYIGFSAAEKLAIPVIGAGIDSTHADPRVRLAVRSPTVDAAMAQPFQLHAGRRTVVVRFSQSHQRGALDAGFSARPQDLVGSSNAVWDIAQLIAEALRLA